MDENQIGEIFERFGLTASKREEFLQFAQQGPLSLEPQQPADFRLDCMTLSEDSSGEDRVAELA